MYVESTIKMEGDLWEWCSSRDEFNGENIKIDDNVMTLLHVLKAFSFRE